MSSPNGRDIFPGLSSVKYETIDLVNDGYLEEPITLKLSDEYLGDTSEDYQPIDAEIIDFGVSEDELEDTLLSLDTSSKIPSKRSSLKSSELSNCNLKCLCVKVVDCDKYPWYYRKYKKQILHRKYFDRINNAKIKWNCLDHDVRGSNNTGEIHVVRKDISENDSLNNDEDVKTDMHLTALDPKKSLNDKKRLASQAEEKRARQKLQMPIDKAKINSKDIDIKKNTGLIGMKVQRMVEDASINKKRAIKKKKEKSRKSIEKKLNKDSGSSTEKTMEHKTIEKLHHYALTVPVIHEIKTKTLETEKNLREPQKKQYNEFTSRINNKTLEKNVESICDSQVTENVYKNSANTKPTDNEECTKKENNFHNFTNNEGYTKEGEVLYLNNFTKKVLQMVKRNANIGNKSSIQDAVAMKAIFNSTSKQELKKLNETKLKKLISIETYPMPIEEVSCKDWNVSNNKKVNSAGTLIENKNKIMTHDNDNMKNTIPYTMTTSKNTDDPKVSQATCCNSVMITESNNKEAKTNASNTQPNIVVNTKSPLKLPAEIPHNLAKFGGNNINKNKQDRRKQTIKLFEKVVGDIEGLVSQINKICPKNTPAQNLPKLQQNQLPTQNTASNNTSNSNNAEIIPTRSVVKGTNHVPIQPQISAILIRPTQSPTISTAKINVMPVASSAQPYNTAPKYQTMPNFQANTPRSLMSIPVPQLFSNPPPPTRHRLPFQQMCTTNRNAYQNPNNYARPMVQRCSQMRPFNTNDCQEENSYMLNYMQNNNNLHHNYRQNNYGQQPVAAGQGYQVTSPSTNAPPGICDVLPNNVRWQYDYVNANSALNFFRPPPPPPPPVPPFQKRPWPQNQLPPENQQFLQGQKLPQGQLPTPIRPPLQKQQIPETPPPSQQQRLPEKQLLPQKQPPLQQQRLEEKQTVLQQQPPLAKQLPPQQLQLPKQPLYQQQLSVQQQPPLLKQPQYQQQQPLQQQMPLPKQQFYQQQQPPLQQQPQPENQSFFQNNSNHSELINSSIIGTNPSGLVKKINISAPFIIESQNVNKSDKKVLTSTVDDTNPSKSKTEMKEHDNSTAVKTTVNKQLKRTVPFEQSPDRAPNLKYKPGPLSKKFKANDQLATSPEKQTSNSGYSPPILPIPTYQNILSEVQAKMFDNISASKMNSNKKYDLYKKFSKTERLEKEHNLKKISLKEYKNRSMPSQKD